MARTREDRSNFLRLLAEKPFIYYACRKAGISRATIYRWMKDNPAFKAEVERVLQEGKINQSEGVEMMLVKRAMEGHFQSMRYYLAHNTSKYRPQRAVWPPPAFSPEQLEAMNKVYEWVHRNKPIPPEQREQMIRAMKNWGWIDAEGKPTGELKQTITKMQKDMDPDLPR